MKVISDTAINDDGPKGTICLLPSLLTTASLFSGFYAIISAINGVYFNAAVALLISGVLDGLDGRIARLTKTSSHFGMEYDSLCDLVAFGVAPAVLVYLWALEDFGRYGWLAAFLYVATTALRLARFNTRNEEDAKKRFTGLPCPAAAGMIATTILFSQFIEIGQSFKGVPILLLVYGLSYLMVSSFKYVSFKNIETTRAKKFQVMVFMVLFIMVLASEPQITLFVVALVYILSGPVSTAYGLLSGSKKTVEEQESLL